MDTEIRAGYLHIIAASLILLAALMPIIRAIVQNSRVRDGTRSFLALLFAFLPSLAIFVLAVSAVVVLIRSGNLVDATGLFLVSMIISTVSYLCGRSPASRLDTSYLIVGYFLLSLLLMLIVACGLHNVSPEGSTTGLPTENSTGVGETTPVERIDE